MARARSNRSGFEQRLLRTMRASGVESGERLTVAFSGGVDSLVLSTALHRVIPVLKTEVQLVHVDHGIRSGSATAAAACQTLAEALGFPISVIELEPGLRERSTGIGLEEAARRERYESLNAAASDWGSSTIVLGHQADDQAETILLHLVRGAGLDGLAGMRPVERRRIPWWTPESHTDSEVTLLRPLLSEPRMVINGYAAVLGLQPVLDESNAETDFDRNWIRHRVLPEILQRWPRAVETMSRNAVVLDADRRFMREAADIAFGRALCDDRTLCTDTLRALDTAVAQRVIGQWLLSIGLRETDAEAVTRVAELAVSGDEDRIVEVGGNRTVVLDGRRLIELGQLLSEASGAFPVEAGETGSSWSIDIHDEPNSGDLEIEAPMDAPVRVRTLRAGDRWFGTNASVAEDLRVAGIHPLLRARLLAAVAPAGVLLIPAIYPTIRTVIGVGSGKKVGVRWYKRS